MSRRSARNTGGPAEGIGAPIVQAHMIPSVAAVPMSSSTYLQNYYSHPASTRLLLGNISQSSSNKVQHAVGGAVPKAPKPPEKPLMPYMRYSRKVWDDVKAGNPELKLWEIGKIIGQMWRELPQPDKQQYVEEYEIDKIEHVEQLKLYHNSPAYQAYLHAKTRAEAMEASAESLGGDKDDAYMSIEPTDDGADDPDMCFSVKHVAAARFQRNHRLINDILGETIHVPSTRAVVTSQRLNVLKNQVQSLELHQKKLEAELVHLEDAHTQKKRKLIVRAREFEKDIKRLRETTPQDYYKEYKLKQQQALQKQQEEAKKAKEESQNQECKNDGNKDNKEEMKTENEPEEEKPRSAEGENTCKEDTEEENKDRDSKNEGNEERVEDEESDSTTAQSSDKPEIQSDETKEDGTGDIANNSTTGSESRTEDTEMEEHKSDITEENDSAEAKVNDED